MRINDEKLKALLEHAEWLIGWNEVPDELVRVCQDPGGFTPEAAKAIVALGCSGVDLIDDLQEARVALRIALDEIEAVGIAESHIFGPRADVEEVVRAALAPQEGAP